MLIAVPIATELLLKVFIKAIHDQGLRHHDLHPRKFVRNSAGKSSIIDFGFAGVCNDPECKDEWKPVWAS